MIIKIVCAYCENWKMQNNSKNKNIFHNLTTQLSFDVPMLVQVFVPRNCQHTVSIIL